MAVSVRVKFHRNGFYEVRRAEKVVAFLEAAGQQLMTDANATLKEGRGYRMSSSQGRRKPQGRWAVRVYTSSNHAKRSNAKRNTLLRVLGSQ